MSQNNKFNQIRIKVDEAISAIADKITDLENAIKSLPEGENKDFLAMDVHTKLRDELDRIETLL